MKKILVLLVFIIIFVFIFTRVPKKSTELVSTKFTNEHEINIVGYAGDAMEPFISRDGQYLFWNGLNDGVDTNIFYARKLDDSNFQFVGKVSGVNGQPPHLDAVVSMDNNGSFYWVSTRNYPNVFENYQHGRFSNGVVTEVAPLDGNFYVRQPGWLIMDAEINPDGELLFFVNAKFTGGALPVESDIGVASRVGNKFMKNPNSEIIFQNINTKNNLEYAPSISVDGKKIFFTRLTKNTTRIYVADRNSLSEPFGKPELLDIKGGVPEAPSVTTDGKTIYYHKKDGRIYKIYKMTKGL